MALRFHLGLFIFNPYGVVALPGPFPRFHLGLFIFNPYGQVPPGAIHIQPLRGWGPINS